uniref:PNPLA domain-containing protein n=1 Tax=Anolis carolinensis TaxID=28377 RepID=A0A803T8U0_ANOCA
MGKTFTFTLVLTILICMSLWLDLFPLSWTDDVKKCLYGAARDARRTILGPFAPGCSILRILQRRLHQILPENSHRMATGRLYISLTRLMDGKNVVVSEYNSKEELIQVTTFPPLFVYRYVDGGFTNLQPRSDLETAITVSPFTGEIDICPRDCPAIFYSLHIVHGSIQVSIENLCRIGYALFPPNPELVQLMTKLLLDESLPLSFLNF